MDTSNIPQILIQAVAALLQVLQVLIHFWIIVLQALLTLIDVLLRHVS